MGARWSILALLMAAVLAGCSTTAAAGDSTASAKPSKSSTKAAPTPSSTWSASGSTASPNQTWASDQLYNACLEVGAGAFDSERLPTLCQCYVQAAQSGTTAPSPTTASPAPAPTGVEQIASMCSSESSPPTATATSATPSSSTIASGSARPTQSTGAPTTSKPTCTASQARQWTNAKQTRDAATNRITTARQRIAQLRIDYQQAVSTGNNPQAQTILTSIKAQQGTIATDQVAVANGNAIMEAIDRACLRT